MTIFIKENRLLFILASVTAIGWSCSFFVILLGYYGAGFRTMWDEDVGVPVVETVQVFLVAGVVAGGIAGLLAGCRDWFIIRHRLNEPKKWVVANVLGWTIAWGIIFSWLGYNFRLYESIIGEKPNGVENAFIFIIGGGIIGIAQWFVLQQQIRDTVGWIIVNAVLFPLAIIIGWLLSGYDGAVTLTTGVVLGGFIAGIIAGTILALFLNGERKIIN